MQKANKYMKRHLTSLSIWEMQIKTMIRNHYTLTKTAKIKNSVTTNCWWRCRETYLIHCWCDWKMVQPPWIRFWQFLHINVDPCNHTPEHSSQRNKTYIHRKTCSQMFIVDLFVTAPNGIKMSFNKWMVKHRWYIHHMGYYSNKRTS